MTPPSTSRVKVVVVDDITVVREGFAIVHPDVDVIATYPTVENLLVERPVADLIVLDLKLSGGPAQGVRQGPTATREVAKAGYRVCLYTEERRRLVLAYCLRAGADGIVHKSDTAHDATLAFQQIANGQTVITQSLVAVAEVLQRHGKLPELTEKQLAVLRGRARGRRWADIAASLYITEATARGHMAVVNDKFAGYLAGASPADLEHELGVAPGDLRDPN